MKKESQCPKSELALSEEMDNPNGNKRHNNVFLSGSRYYFKVTLDGKRRTISTHATTKEEAEEFRDNWYKAEFSDTDYLESAIPKTLNQLLTLFQNASTNPKLADAGISVRNYTERHARNEGRHYKNLKQILPIDYLGKRLRELRKEDCIAIRKIIHKSYGNTYKGHDHFKSFKASISYAYQCGWVKEPLTFRMPDIKVIKKEKPMPIYWEDAFMISKNPINFRNETERDIFRLLMLTGLRRAELCALQGKQIKRARLGDREIVVLKIDQSFKDDNFKTLGLPKWDVIRVFPVCKSAAEILLKYKGADNEFLFHMTNSMWTDAFEYIRGMVMKEDMIYPEALEFLSPHKLRHALNTIMLEKDVPSILVQEYFGWHHQDENKVQQGYTHLYIKPLMRVADEIENLMTLGGKDEDDLIYLD